jgi:hypothetical protein
MRIPCDLFVCFYFLRKLDAVLSCLCVCLCPSDNIKPIGSVQDTCYAHLALKVILPS